MLNGNPVTIESVSAELLKLDADHKATKSELLKSLAKERAAAVKAIAEPYRKRRLKLARLLACLQEETGGKQ